MPLFDDFFIKVSVLDVQQLSRLTSGFVDGERLRIRPVNYFRDSDMDKREYDQLSSLTNSSNEEISGLSIIVKNLKERLESLEKNQTSLMDKINALERGLARDKDD